MDTLGNVLTITVISLSALSIAWGAVGHVVRRHRARQVVAEFRPPTDVELITGVRELARAVALQRQSEQARDMHVRYWR